MAAGSATRRLGSITCDVIQDISEKTRIWYFHRGGIYLTEHSRKPYFRLKELMQHVLDARERDEKKSEDVLKQCLPAILRAGSLLRTKLSDDIGTKRLSRL